MNPPVRTRRPLLIAVVAAVSLLLAPGSAPTANAAAAPAAGSGWARFGHFAPAQDAVDIYVDGTLVAPGVVFKTVTSYMPLPSGPHRFDIRATAGDPTTEPILSVDAGVPESASITIGAISTRDGIAPQIYTDDLVQPPADQALVRFIHAAPDVAAVDINVVGGPDLATNVAYPAATGYNPITPGTYDVEVRSANTDQVVLRVDEWSIAAGVQSSIVFVQGLDGSIDVAPVTDTVAVAAAPLGGIQTGGGSMADILDPAGHPHPISITPMLATITLGAAAGTVITRKHRKQAP